MNPLIQRAYLLIERRRWELAEADLRQALAADPGNAEAHRLLSACHLAREQFDAAEQEARAAIHLAPDDAKSHQALAWILFHRHRFAESHAAVMESIRLDPRDSNSYAILSQLFQQRSDWMGMLDAANLGLQVDPEDVDCNNLRAVALTKLGRREEAGRTIGAALARDPENPLTQANEGWRLLENRERAKAMDHFREALRLDPENAWARAGIVEGLKSKNIVYRLLLGYFLYMSRLKSQAQWALLIGAYVLFQFGAQAAKAHPAAAPYIQPFLYAYAAFAVLTWLGSSIFNLLLLLDKSGRHALSTDQKRGALTVGLILLASLILAALGACFRDESPGYILFGKVWIFVGLTAIPAASIFVCSAGWPRWAMAAATLALGALGLASMASFLLYKVGVAPAEFVIGVVRNSESGFLYGFLGSQFLAMTLMNVEPRR